MKKTLILLAALFTLQFAFTQVTDSIKIQISNTERIVDKYSEKIANTFEKGLAKVTPLAERGFEIAVRYTIADGLVCLIPTIICIISMIVFFRECNNAYKKGLEPFRCRGDCNAIIVISLIMFIISTAIAIFTIGPAIARLIAPEWFAIKNIIELFK